MDNDASVMPASLTVLKDVAEALNETSDVAEAMSAILPRLSDALGLTTAWAFRFDASRRSFVEVAASGLPSALSCDDSAPLKTGWCECQDQFMNGRLSSAINIVRCSRLRDATGDKRGLRYHASIPLRSKGKPLGILNVAAEGHHVFTKAALGLLMTIGNQVAVAVDRAGILADERQRTRQLGAMSTFAANLVGMVRVEQILDYTVNQFVDQLGYEACGIIRATASGSEDATLLFAAHQKSEVTSEYQYSYDQTEGENTASAATESKEPEGLILPIARSVIEHQVPHTDYRIRLESPRHRVFRQPDEDLLASFAWHLRAALLNAASYGESLDNAKWLERRKLAAELHDSVSQRLFSAKLLADALLLAAEEMSDGQTAREDDARPGDVMNSAGNVTHSAPQQGSETELAKHLSRLIEDSQREMRAMIDTLRPLEERGWSDRVRERIAHLQLQGQTRFHLKMDLPKEYPIPYALQDCLLKVIDESTHNIMSHAQAKHAHIRLWNQNERIFLTVEDDGLGFDIATVQKGLGTSTMVDRARSVGGELRILSEPGRGTSIRCELPYDSDARE